MVYLYEIVLTSMGSMTVVFYTLYIYLQITKNDKAKLILNFRSELPYTNRLFAYRKGGNFDIHIWA